ncbi:RHS repeat domain-containing protein [Leptospira stimsonii]|uniref:RHS repeat domain-containing protein n=1 Tax=Leptospira stimsonii TaxID=2202203 RepID=UPI00240DC8C9|nr:RHS repeat-associated core domain-containing protein [Leptospira stimsonii]
MRACYEYGTAGYITRISVQVNTNGILPGFCNKDIVENITYNEFGQTAGFELGNGIETTYTYDIKGRMVRIHSSGDVGGSTKVLQDAVYSFNNKNDIVGITNATGEFNSQYDYDYDGIGRLTNAIGNYVETADNLNKSFQQSYSYAKNGNLIAKRIHDPANGAIQDEWTYQYTNHQVTNIDSSKTGTDTFTLQYDANGNLTRQRDNAKDLTKRISVDSQDRIVQIQDANNAILGPYWYDEGGFRVRRSALEPKNNQFTNVEILYPSKFYGLEYIESENVITSVNNVYLNGVRIAALNEAGALAYFLTDQVDSVSHVLDDEGNTLSRMQYLPYGDTFVHKGDTNFAPKYNSQELDRESGFYFYNARYYDPGIARFTSADTIIDGESDTQGWNRFSYVKGNPIGAKDPSGHCLTQGMRSFFAATCSNASVQADKATHQDVNNRINYQNNSSFLKTATVVNGLAKGTPTSVGISLAMKAAGKIPGIKEGSEKLNEKLGGDNPKVAELRNFGLVLGSTMVGMGTTGLRGNLGTASSVYKSPITTNPNQYLYRGVHAKHPALNAAKKGNIVPGNSQGSITTEMHNGGGYSAKSPYTSWTDDINVAKEHALKSGKGGVILRVEKGAPEKGATWKWESSPDKFSESERLLKGTRSGADVLRP